MKDTFLFIVVLMFAAHLSAQPKIQLKNAKIGIGTIYQGEIKKINVIVSNAGDQPLTISRIETSCGCTSARTSVPTLSPATSDTIEVSFNSMGFNGNITKLITIQSNDPSKPYIDAVITGTVATELEIVPKMPVLNFGTAPVGQKGSASFVFRNASSERITFRGVTGTDSSVHAQIGFRTLEPSDTITISFTFTPRGTSYTDNYFYIETDSPRQPRVPFRFMYVGK